MIALDTEKDHPALLTVAARPLDGRWHHFEPGQKLAGWRFTHLVISEKELVWLLQNQAYASSLLKHFRPERPA